MDLFKIVTLLDGRVISVMHPRGADYARAAYRTQQQKEFDILPFLMSEICRFNGEKQSEKFYLDLMCDDYLKMMEVMGELITVIR